MTLLPQLQRLNLFSSDTARRFPMPLAAAAVAGVAAILTVQGPLEHTGGRLWLTAVLGIPLFTMATLCLERGGWPGRRAALAHLAGILFLTAFFAAWPGWTTAVSGYRWLQWAVGLHLFVAVLPFAAVGEPNGFWQFNRILLQRLLVSALFTVVLYVGLAVALFSLEELFGLAVDDHVYLQLWAGLAIMFNTWIFLGGVPQNLESLQDVPAYPTGLRIFAQYILAPLVAVYLLILTAYFGKVIVTATWPSGWIGWLVSSVAVTGILSLLLLDPVRRGGGPSWARAYAQWFYVALFPSIVMLLMATWQRIAQYGITEPRYYLVVLTLWLGVLAVYSTVRNRSTIKVIPLTLGALAFATSLGPLGAYQVSQRSQTKRLGALLERTGVLIDGRARRTSETASTEDTREIDAVLRYLVHNHGTQSLVGWFPEGAPASALVHRLAGEPSRISWEHVRTIAEALGVSHVGEWQIALREQFDYRAGTNDVHTVTGYDYAITVGNAPLDSVVVGEHALVMERDTLGYLTITLGGEQIGRFDLAGMVAALDEMDEGGEVPADALRLESTHRGYRLALHVGSIAGRREDGGSAISSVSGVVYLDMPDAN